MASTCSARRHRHTSMAQPLAHNQHTRTGGGTPANAQPRARTCAPAAPWPCCAWPCSSSAAATPLTAGSGDRPRPWVAPPPLPPLPTDPSPAPLLPLLAHQQRMRGAGPAQPRCRPACSSLQPTRPSWAMAAACLASHLCRKHRSDAGAMDMTPTTPQQRRELGMRGEQVWGCRTLNRAA